jgi:hypothetical protein
MNNCQTANVRMTTVCKGTERKPVDTKEMVPRLGPERADFMLNEDRSMEKLCVSISFLKESRRSPLYVSFAVCSCHPALGTYMTSLQF